MTNAPTPKTPNDALKQIIIGALKDNTTEMEGYSYFGSNPGVPKDSYEDVADQIIVVWNRCSVPQGELPPLPNYGVFGQKWPLGYTADQMREYALAALAQPAAQSDRKDAARLDFLDANEKFRMGWKVGVAPVGNVSVTSVIMGGKSIREAIDIAMGKEQGQ